MDFKALLHFGKMPERLVKRKMTAARFRQFAKRHNASIGKRKK